MELLTLSLFLDPNDTLKTFNIGDICNLVKNFYPSNFTQKDLNNLRRQLKFYEIDVTCHPKFQNISSLFKLCQDLTKSNKSQIYVLTLNVAIATTKCAFLIIKLIKTSLRLYDIKIFHLFLIDCMNLFIEK